MPKATAVAFGHPLHLGRAGLVAGLVHQLVFLDPRHHRAQGLADLLNLVLGRQAAPTQQGGGTRFVFQDKTLGVFAGLNVL